MKMISNHVMNLIGDSADELLLSQIETALKDAQVFISSDEILVMETHLYSDLGMNAGNLYLFGEWVGEHVGRVVSQRSKDSWRTVGDVVLYINRQLEIKR